MHTASQSCLKSLEESFRAEIRQWRLSAEEESMIRMIVVCVAIRMRGEKPSDVFKIKDRIPE